MISALSKHLDINHALCLSVAAWLAFAIAIMLDIPNPYWAAMPIWVVSQSSRGLLFERAFYRIVGSLLGGLLGFGITYFFANPFIEILALAFIVASFAGGAHIVRGVLSYGMTLTAITAVVIVLPAVLAPGISGELVVSRLQCTLIGVIVVTFTTAFFTPESPRKEFYKSARKLSADTIFFLVSLLNKSSPEELAAQEYHLLKHLSDIDANAKMVSAGSVEGYQRVQTIEALISASLGVMAIGKALKNYGEDHFIKELNSLAAWFASEDVNKQPPILNWGDEPVLKRLKKAIEQLIKTEILLLSSPTSADAKSFGKKFKYLAPQRDWQLAVRCGVVAGVATALAGMIGYVSGWKYGELAAMGVCIFSVVLGTMPHPRKIAPYMLIGVLSGGVLAVGYRIFIQPYLVDEIAIIVSFIPFMLLGGFLRTHKTTSLAALDFNMVFLLAGQAGMAASTDVYDILSGASAIAIAAIPITLSHIFLPRPYRKLAQRSKASLKRMLRELTYNPKSSVNWHAKSGRYILRYFLYLEYGGSLPAKAPPGILETLNFGYAISALKKFQASEYLPEVMEALRKLIDEPSSSVQRAHLSWVQARDPRLATSLEEILSALDGYNLFIYEDKPAE